MFRSCPTHPFHSKSLICTDVYGGNNLQSNAASKVRADGVGASLVVKLAVNNLGKDHWTRISLRGQSLSREPISLVH